MPEVQSQPSEVHGGLHSASVMQVPVPPGVSAPQHSSPSSQAPSVPEVQLQPSLVHEGLHSASVWQVPGPPGWVTPQQTRPSSQLSWTPPLHAQPSPVQWLTHFVPYWSEAVAVVLPQGAPVLLAALTERVHPWIREVSHLAEVISAPRLGAKAAAFLSERVAANTGKSNGKSDGFC